MPRSCSLQTLVQQRSMLQAAEGATVGRVRVAGFSLSLDGFGAGPEQSLEDPLGKRGTELHRWFVGTKTFRAMFGKGGGSEGVGRDLCPPLDGRLWCLHPWPEHVRSGAWGMAGRQLEGLVGRQYALSRSDARPNAPCPRAERYRGG